VSIPSSVTDLARSEIVLQSRESAQLRSFTGLRVSVRYQFEWRRTRRGCPPWCRADRFVQCEIRAPHSTESREAASGAAEGA
jgi:hypothetical protein